MEPLTLLSALINLDFHSKDEENEQPQKIFSQDQVQEISIILKKFNTANDGAFKFSKMKDCKELSEVVFGVLQNVMSHYSETLNQQIMAGFTKELLSCLKILNREKEVVEMVSQNKKHVWVLLSLGNIANEVISEDACKTLGVRNKNFEEGNEIECLKVICNCLFHSQNFRKKYLENKCSKAITKNIKERSEKWNSNDELLVIQMKILFLISALEVEERIKMQKDYLVATELVDLLWECIHSKLDIHDKDERESSGKRSLKLSENDVKLISEILKTLFNITVKASNDALEQSEFLDYEKLTQALHFFLTDFVPLPDSPEIVICHIAHMLINIPKQCLQNLIPTVKRRQWQDPVPRLEGYPTEYELKDMSAIITLVTTLDTALLKGVDGSQDNSKAFSVLTSLCHICRCLRLIRKYLRFEILPPLKEATQRPEDSNSLKGRLVRLMTNPDTSLKGMAADLLFVLCKEDSDRLVKYTGYGNAAGFLATRGLMSGRKAEMTGDYSSDDDDSETEEYNTVANDIDPITGAVSTKSKDNDPMAGMTDEEKAASAEELVGIIGKLSSLGVVKPMKIGEDGRPCEIDENETQRFIQDKLEEVKKNP